MKENIVFTRILLSLILQKRKKEKFSGLLTFAVAAAPADEYP
jgi:hypothetical protein